MFIPFLNFLQADLNDFIGEKIGASGSFVLCANLNNITEGATEADKKVFISIVNIEEEKLLRSPDNYTKLNNEINYRKPPVWLNIVCMFTYYSKSTGDYEGLDLLANVVQYFQSRPRMNKTTAVDTDNFPPGFEEIRAEFMSLNFEQSNNLWGLFGGRYYPSVLYRFKTIPIDNIDITPGGPPITETQVDAKHKTTPN